MYIKFEDQNLFFSMPPALYDINMDWSSEQIEMFEKAKNTNHTIINYAGKDL
jgi:hypothetical protein